ncbi:MAG TPA: hypothetical protein VGC41_05740 [Kofleriaceae bacterium]
MWRGLLLLSVFAGISQADEILDKSFVPPSSVQPRSEPAGPPTETIHASYRNETITADALSIALTMTVYIDMSDRHEAALAPLFATGLLGSVFATPIIHAIHGHGMRGVGSYLLRSGLGMMGMVVAIETKNCGSGEFADLFCGFERAPAGFAIGIALAATFDAIALTDETHERPIQSAHNWTPMIAPQRGGAEVGFAASF